MNMFKSRSEGEDNEVPLEKRKLEAEKILQKYPDRIPCIVENANKSTLPRLMKKKFLVPQELTIQQFLLVIRKRIKVREDKALFLIVNNILPKANTSMAEAYSQYKGEDGFLTFKLSEENTFGICM